MSKVAIVTDSNSGITQSKAKEIGISVIPMPFMIIGETFEEDINLTQEQFYDNLVECSEIYTDTYSRPLVKTNELIIDVTPEPDESGWMPTPLQCSLLFFIQTAAATTYGIRRRTGLWGIDLVLYVMAGIVGCVLAFLAFFSQHPAVSSNFLLLVFHPGQLLFLPYIVYCVRKGKKCWYLTLNLVVLTLFIVLFPVIPQRFDFAVVPLALVLLIRSASNLIVTSKKK